MIVAKLFFGMTMLGIVTLIMGGLLWENVLGRRANERLMNVAYAMFLTGATGLLLFATWMALSSIP